MINRIGFKTYRIFILGLLTVSIIAPYEIIEAETDNTIINSTNFSFTSNYILYDINNNGLNDTLELTVIINWVQNFTHDIRILINFNEYSLANTYIDHILEYRNSNQPNTVTLNYRWFSIYKGDVLVRISVFLVGFPEQSESFIWESADPLQIQQELISNYEFSWNKNDAMRNLDIYDLELTLKWQNVTFINSVEINVYEFIIPTNRYLLDRSTTQTTSVFGNGTSAFTFNGTRNSNTNKRILIEVISQDFEPLESEILWEIYPDTYTVYVTKILSNTTSEPIDDKIESRQSFFTQPIYLSLVALGLLITTVILRKRK